MSAPTVAARIDAHLLYGNELLYELLDPGEQEWVEELMEQCAGSGTVLYSRLAGEPGEDWQAYVRRLARLAMAPLNSRH